jgi:epoxyqueuosine reductase QueG
MAIDLEKHPVVIRYRERKNLPPKDIKVDSEWLRKICIDSGADDVAFVAIDHADLHAEKPNIEAVLPGTKTLIALVAKLNRGAIRTPARSISNTEFHHVGDALNHVTHKIVEILEENGMRAVNPAVGFPMEADRWNEGRMWTVSHKTIAVAAGLGKMGIHRNVIHPKFGSFILLSTILTNTEVSDYNGPLDYNPCVECKLCVAACPTGAIGPDGEFNFSACYTHNYREFMGGFLNWVETITNSQNSSEYRKKFTSSETVSMWQSLSYGANYKAAYCLSVCPAGEEVIGPFLENRPNFLSTVVKPLQDKSEVVYVVAASDAEDHVAKRFPNKKTKRVSNGLSANSIAQFLGSLPNFFQRNQAKGIDACYHFTFTGDEQDKATIMIRNQKLDVQHGHFGKADLHITADSRSWLAFLKKEKNIVWEILRRKIRLRGNPRLLLQFGKCFPS